MLTYYFESKSTIKQLAESPAGPWLGGFAQFLRQEGYSWWVGRSYVRGAYHLGIFLRRKGRPIASLGPLQINEFRTHMKQCHCARPRGRRGPDTVRGAKRFLEYLWKIGAVPKPKADAPPAVVCTFGLWLKQHRGLSDVTVHRYADAATKLLRQLGKPNHFDATVLRNFFLSYAHGRPGGISSVASGIRMFLRYLASNGKCRPGLDAAIPAVAQWRLSSLPRSLSAEEVEKLLSACPRRTSMGLRDRAVILLLARLGLRAGDVAALRFGDVDWVDGSILVSGKGRRQSRLPLPQDVGDAVIAYVRRRPRRQHDQIFLRAVAPYRPLPARGLSQIVARAMRRAKVSGSTYGAHILRHTAATEMLRHGVSLYDIGQVLRHRSIDMSAYYAKVDVPLLMRVAQPWPEALPC